MKFKIKDVDGDIIEVSSKSTAKVAFTGEFVATVKMGPYSWIGNQDNVHALIEALQECLAESQ